MNPESLVRASSFSKTTESESLAGRPTVVGDYDETHDTLIEGSFDTQRKSALVRIFSKSVQLFKDIVKIVV